MGRLNLEYDATNSWSGYNHQGKVALLVALRKLCELRQSDPSQIANYYLEIEWLEDFSIVRTIGGGGRAYDTIHQVKAREDVNLKAYAEPLSKLAMKIKQHPSISKAYLHTRGKVKYLDSDWQGQLKATLSTDNDFMKDIASIDEYLTYSDKKMDLVQKISKRGRPTNFISGLKEYFSEKITELNIDEALLCYKEKLTEYINFFKIGSDDSIINKLSLYQYNVAAEIDDYCPVDRINGLIKNTIAEYWSNAVSPTFWKISDSNYQEKVFLYLLGLMDRHLIYRHTNYRKDPIRTIPLTEIEDILNNDNLDERCREYYLYQLKMQILNAHAGYCESCLSQICQTGNGNCKVKDIASRLEQLSFEDFESFIYLTSPNISGVLNKITYEKHTQNTEGFNSPFFKGLREISRDYMGEKLPVSFQPSSQDLYLLTTLHDTGIDQSKEKICYDIMNNSDIVSLFMDYTTVISKDFNSNSIFEDAGNYIAGCVTIDELDYEHICHYKKVNIKPINESIKELNDASCSE